MNRHCQAMNFQTGEKGPIIFWQSENRFSIQYFFKRDRLFIFTPSVFNPLEVRRLRGVGRQVVRRCTEKKKNLPAYLILVIVYKINTFLTTHHETISIVKSLKRNTNSPPFRLAITTLLRYIAAYTMSVTQQ